MENYKFFDSIDGEDERFYTADEFADYFRQLIRNGIFAGGENLKVDATGADMTVLIKQGYAWIEGYLYKIETEPLTVEHETADSELNRIDRIVIRLDKSLDKRYVKAFVLKGEPALAPLPPELTRTDNVYELSLGQVEIIGGKSFIESYQITDERLNNDVCGIVTHLFEQVDTRALFNEWQQYLSAKRAQGEVGFTTFTDYLTTTKMDAGSQYATFLAVLQSKLITFENTWASWVADKLKNPSGEFYRVWQNWFEGIKLSWNQWFDYEIKQVWQNWVRDKLQAPDGEFYTEWQDWFEEIQDTTALVPRSHFVAHQEKTVKDSVHGLRLGSNQLEVEIRHGVWYRLDEPSAINTWGGM